MQNLKRTITTLIITAQLAQSIWPVLPVFAAESEPIPEPTEITRPTETIPPQEPSGIAAALAAEKNINEITLYAEARRKLKLNPIDERELERWIEVSKAIKQLETSNPDAYAIFQGSNYKTIPTEIRSQFGLDRKPLANFSKQVLEGIFLMVTDPKAKEGGANGDYLEVSRLLADYDSEKKSISREGEEKDPDILERTVSSHFEEHVEAADLAAFDYILCTEITIEKDQTNSQLKVTDRDKKKPIPIEFIWQAEENRRAALGGKSSSDGSLSPNTLGSLLGVSPADLFRRIGRDNILGEILDMLDAGGWSFTPDDILLSQDWSTGTTELSDIYDRLAQATLRDVFGASLGGNPLRLGGNLLETIDETGAAILAQAFAKMPAGAVGGESLAEWADQLARADLGERLVDSGFRFIGDSGHDIARDLGLQYFTAKVLNLAPTTALGQMDLSSPQAVRIALGKIATEQKLGTTDLTIGGVQANPELADSRLNLLAGTSGRLVSGGLSTDQYYELVGQAVIDTSLSAYADNGQVRMRATNLAINLGPEDFFVPDSANYPSVADEVRDLEGLYRSRMTEADWQFFASHYKASSFGDLDEDSEIRSWLTTHTIDTTDLISPVLTGGATDAGWTEMGLRVLAKVDPKPLGQLAILRYLQTGAMPTIAISTNDERAPITDIDLMAGDRLGLLPGDFERIRTDRFGTEVLPRLSTDLFIEAIGLTGTDGFLAGATRQTEPSDDFLIETLRGLGEQAKSIRSLSTDGRSARDQFVGVVEGFGSSDWSETTTETRTRRLSRVLASVGMNYLALDKHLEPGDRYDLRRLIAGLMAGRTLTDVNELDTPDTLAVNRSLGLNATTLDQLFTGETTPNELKRSLGANYLTSYMWDGDDPETMAADLITAAKTNTQAALTNFFQTYQTEFTELAELYEDTLAIGGTQLTSEQFLGLFTGNRLPLFGRLGSLIHQSVTGQAGSIFSGGGDQFLAATGLTNLLSANGWIGNLETLGANVQNIPRLIAEQSLGLTWADNPTDFLSANGTDFLRLLGAPEQIVDQFDAIWDPSNPEAALNLLKQPATWANMVGVDDIFRNTFGNDIGGPMANQFRDIFLSGKNPNEVLTSIKNNPERFFPDIAEALDLPFDPTQLYTAIKTGNDAALQTELINLGGQFIDHRIAGLASIITSNDHSPQAILNYATTAMPEFFGDPTIAGLAALGTAAHDYFASGQTDTAGLLAAAGQFGSTIGIPYVADAMQIFADPRGFGTSYAAATITSQLNQAFGGGYIDYGTVRNALFGPDPKIIAAEAAAIRAQIDGDPELVAAFGSLDQESQQLLLESKLREKMADVQGAAQQNLMYSVTDAVAGLPAGFTKTMITGTDNQKLDALFIAADQLTGGLPAEARVALELIKNKGDVTQITNLTFGYLDGQLSNIIGVPLPPGFTKNTADFLTGKIDFDQLTTQMGPFAIGQVSGALDQQLGLPVGTSYQLYQGISQLTELNGQLGTLQNDLINQFGLGDEAATSALSGRINDIKGQIGRLEAGLAGFAVNLVFGEQLAGIEQSLALPAGTMNFFISSALGSIFTGGSFIGIMGAAFPMFAGGILVGKFLGLGSLIPGLGGGGKQQATWCSPGGFYPYVKRGKTEDGKDEEGLFDPNENLDIYDPKKRLKPEEVVEKLDIWPGYPGEFMGEETSPESYAWGKRASARWKVRELAGNLLLLPQRTNNERMQPNQLILYEIPEAARGKDGDYMKYYDGREKDDDRFIKTNLVGDELGIIDWPFPWEDGYAAPGYGDGTPNSGNALHPDSRQQSHYGNYNIGFWVEQSDEYRHHIHYGG